MRAQQHWRELDGMRGALAFGIVLLHFGFNAMAARLGWRGMTFQLAVDVFFLLSGYVLAHSARAGVDPRRFAMKRFLRLAPVFYVTTLVAVLCNGGFQPLELLGAMPFTGADPVNFPAWSVCWEFYLPVMAVLIPWRIPDRAVIPLLILCLIGLGIADIGVAAGERHYFARALLGLAGGYLLYRSGLESRLPMVALCLFLAGIMAASRYFPPLAFILPAVACAAILAGRRGRTLLSAAPAQFLGTISYTLYLVHIPVLMVLMRITDVNQNPAAKLFGVAASVGFAWLLTRWIERPLMADRGLPAQTAP